MQYKNGLFNSQQRFLSSLKSSTSSQKPNPETQSEPPKSFQYKQNPHTIPNPSFYSQNSEISAQPTPQKPKIPSDNDLDFFQPILKKTESQNYSDKYKHIFEKMEQEEEEEIDDINDYNKIKSNPFPKHEKQCQKEQDFYSQQYQNQKQKKKKLTQEEQNFMKNIRQESQYEWVEIEMDSILQNTKSNQKNPSQNSKNYMKQQQKEALRQLKLLEENDFFAYLEIQCDATQDQIKRAYRKQCLLLHPDKQFGKSQEEQKKNQEKFLNVKRAYKILGNPQLRQIYENEGFEAVQMYEEIDEVMNDI